MRDERCDPYPGQDLRQQIRQVVGEGPEPQARSFGPSGEGARALARALGEAGFVEEGIALQEALARCLVLERAMEVVSRAEEAYLNPSTSIPSQTRDKQLRAYSAAKAAFHACDEASDLDIVVIRGVYAALTCHERRLDAPLINAAASALEELDLPNIADTIRGTDNKLAYELPFSPQLDPDHTRTDMAAWALAEASYTPSAGDEDWLKCQGLLRLAQYLTRAEADSIAESAHHTHT